MAQNSKKISKKGKKKRIIYVAPKPEKPKIWININPGLVMLRNRPVVKEIKIVGKSRKNMNSSACVVAPVYAAVEEFHDWSIALVENIFEIGTELHRITSQQLKLRANSSFPVQCICPTFLLNENKVTILVRPASTSTQIRGGVDSTLQDEQIKDLELLLSENHGLILQCRGDTQAFWKDKNKYFAFIPIGFRDVNNQDATVLKAIDLRNLLENCLQTKRGVCNFYSIKILNKSKIPMTLDNVNEGLISPNNEDLLDIDAQEEPSPGEDEQTSQVEIQAKTKNDLERRNQINQEFSADIMLPFSPDYNELPDNRGILNGKDYCKNSERIPHTIIAASIFLHHFPADLWTSVIIHDIIKLGKTIFDQSEDDELLENEDWIDRIKFPIRFMRKNLSIAFEKVIFGKVNSTDSSILNVEQGLSKFFDENDIGVLAGPQTVLIWQQSNNLFMFDPKERDGLGRKWTRKFSAELGSNATGGSACVTWYRNLSKMADVYIENIPLKHRADPYRIIKIRVFETFSLQEDEGEWKGISDNRWVLVGTKSLCDYSYAEDTFRAGKAICIAVIAIMNAIETPEDDWESNNIDKILREGIDLLKLSLPLNESENQFSLESIKKLVDIGEKRLQITVINCMIRGPMLAESKGKDAVQLETGLREFFNTSRYGVFTVKDISLAIWRGDDNFYYLFYPYEKLFGTSPECLCLKDDYVPQMPPMGIAYIMRFKQIANIFSFLTTFLNTKDTDEYCLNPISISISNAKERPPLQDYEEFGENGAILRPYKNIHEGHEIYGVRADKQTLANLLTALGFNRINSSRSWNKEDLADILNIGDKMFCKIYMALPECHARDYKLQWEDLVPVIGINKFTFTRDPVEGVLEIQPPEPMGEGNEYELGAQEDYDNEEGVEVQDDELFVRPQGSLKGKVSPANDLREILQNWDKMESDHHEAVLETDLYKIAIWKKDNLYFVFDPKASGLNGELTERRIEIGKDQSSSDTFSVAQPQTDEFGEQVPEQPSERPLFLEKRNYTEFDNSGSAYTAWFSNFVDFCDHISSKTPEDFKYGKFTLHNLVLNNTPLIMDDFESRTRPGYRSIAPNHSILRGSITQNNPCLLHRCKLDESNCIVAIAFAKLTPSNTMTTSLLDVIIKYGDRLYTKTLNTLKKKDYERWCDIDKLSLHDISLVFSIYKIKFNWKIISTIKGNFLLNELKKATNKMGTIENGNAMILCYKSFSMAFWKSEGGFYLYDPFETNPNGILADNGLPSLSKFAKLDNLLNYLIKKYICVPGSNIFTLYTINIESTPLENVHSTIVSAEEDQKLKLISKITKDQKMFQPFQNDMRIFKASFTPVKVPQHIIALAALIHSCLQLVELWNYNISQRISLMSRYILQKSDCEIDSSQMSFENIRRNFAIDNNILCNIVFTKNSQGPIFNSRKTEVLGVNLKNSLEFFFRSCQKVIITMPGFANAFSIWKENGHFYLFGCDQEEIFVISSSYLQDLFDIIIKGIDTESGPQNWYELRSVSVNLVPIKKGICKPLKSVENVKEGPLFTRDGDYVFADCKEAHFYDHISEKLEGMLVKQRPTEYVKIVNDIEILYSKDIIKSHRFYGTKDLFLSLQAACVEASALSKLKSPSLWTKKTLEKIISDGVNLYINTIAVKGTLNIQIIDFKGNFYIFNQKLEVSPLSPTVQPASKDELLLCLTWILRKYQTAYLYTDNFCFTLVLENNECYLYFPGSSKMLCGKIRNDSSCLIKFCSISDLLDKLLSIEEISSNESVSIGPIFVYKH